MWITLVLHHSPTELWIEHFASTMMLLLRSSIRQVRKTKDLTRIMNGDCRVRGDEIISEFIQEINRRQRQRGMSEQIISEGENIINENGMA